MSRPARRERTGIARFLWGTGRPEDELGATWWGISAFVVGMTAIALPAKGQWWGLLFVPFAIWCSRKALRSARVRNW
jgi:hypothetical protein